MRLGGGHLHKDTVQEDIEELPWDVTGFYVLRQGHLFDRVCEESILFTAVTPQHWWEIIPWSAIGKKGFKSSRRRRLQEGSRPK